MTQITIKPASAETWDDLEQLFGKSGAYWGCWCMFWRISNKEFNSTNSAGHRIGLKMLFEEKTAYTPGLIAYKNKIPVGWIGFGPRNILVKLQKSRVIPKVDEKIPFSIICFFINKNHRNTGVGSSLILASIEFARNNNHKIIESYPVNILKGEKVKETNAYMGISPLFEKFGFSKVLNTQAKAGGRSRVIMRYQVN